jgi:(R,R)-butanediol dehydrogenase/meso-butanediol dehydrogenase/diacetyl reductase
MIMTDMRASVLYGQTFRTENRPVPEPGPGEVLIKVRSCGICGSDLHVFKHQKHTIETARSLGADVTELERAYNQGVVLGHEFVGEVCAFGPGTERALAVGDRVVSMPFVLKQGAPVLIGSNPETTGAYAEYMTLTEAMLLKVPATVPTEAAAFVEPLGIAVHSVNKAALPDGAAAVIVGAGPIGLAITAVLKARGVRTIIASDLSPKRRELAARMGASDVVNGAEQSPIALAAEKAPGAPLVIFENTGAPGMFGRLVLEAPQNARIVVTGIASGNESFLPMVAIAKELSIVFVIYYSPEEFADALSLIEQGLFDWQALHTGTVGLDGIAGAFSELADPEKHAKILIDPWSDGSLN